MTDEEFLDKKEAMLRAVEDRLYRALLAETVKASIEVEAGSDRQESALGLLNDRMAELIGAELFTLQYSYSDLLLEHHKGSNPGALTPTQWMDNIWLNMEDPVSLKEWTDRASPSRWMRDLFGKTRRQVEAAVESFIASAVWGMAAIQENRVWDPTRMRWVTEKDGKTCGVCAPRDRMVFEIEETLPPYPAHPRCRCSLLPA